VRSVRGEGRHLYELDEERLAALEPELIVTQAVCEVCAVSYDAVRAAVFGASTPRVLALEWLDPAFVGGHWIPEMIEIAGGVDVIGEAGAKSRTAEWDELNASKPEVVVAMPCGWDAPKARQEVLDHAEKVAALGAQRVVAVDAAASFSRPGPRLVEGTELLAHLLHPDRVPAPDGVEFIPLDPVAVT
jgi:iron complex transport system substrate-binding protein